jgi:hypothetical protein
VGVSLADNPEAESLIETPRRIDLEDLEHDRKPTLMRRLADPPGEAGADAVALGFWKQEYPSKEDMVRMLLECEAADRTSGLLDDLVSSRNEALVESLILPRLVPGSPGRPT